jgi:hypothetical protein
MGRFQYFERTPTEGDRMNHRDQELLLAPLRYRFRDAKSVLARLNELGFDATLVEAEGVRTYHAPRATLEALSGADLNVNLRLFLAEVLGRVKRDLARLQALGQPLPELPRRRYERRPRPDQAQALEVRQ